MTAKRRGHGEGSIYQRKDGRWAASITLDHRNRKYFYGNTRREVQEKLKVALREQQQGTLVTAAQQTLKQYLEHWLEDACKPTVKLLTYDKYHIMVHYHLIPALGDVPLQKLTPEMLQKFYRQKLDEGKMPGTVVVIHAVLRRALENAVKSGLIARNIAKLVTPPRIERHEMQVLTVEQAERLLEVARGSSLDALLMMALMTGMRRGELLALRWADVNFEQGTVFVHRTVALLAPYGYVEGEPKTKAGRRRIALPDVAVEALKMQQEAAKKMDDLFKHP